MATLGEFLSPEAGQARRKWLDETLGQIIPPELRGWVNAGAELNPVTNMERAGTAAQRMTAPGLSGWDRMAAAGDMATNMGAVLAPVAGAKAGANSANAIVEALTAASPMKGAVDDFLVDEFGGVGFRAYHGSPHDFDRFDMDKIGTGEGAQAYGHGLYFAENEGIAQSYRDGLSKAINVNGVDVRYGASAADEVESAIKAAGLPSHVADNARWYINRGFSPEQYAADLANDDPEAAKIVAGILKSSDNPGRMYEVQIDANPEDFLDWDKPLSEQPARVRPMLEGWAGALGLDPQTAPFNRVGGLTKSPEGAQALREAGIPGIRYLDAGSRGAGDGSRNYVVFDDKLIEILRKYGLAGAVPLGAVLGQPQDPMGSYLEAQ